MIGFLVDMGIYIGGVGSLILLAMSIIWAAFVLVKKIRQAEKAAFSEED